MINDKKSNADSLLYYHEACQFIDKNWNKEEKIDYAYWGMTENVNCIDKYIRVKFPKANLVRVYDTFKEGYNKDILQRNCLS